MARGQQHRIALQAAREAPQRSQSVGDAHLCGQGGVQSLGKEGSVSVLERCQSLLHALRQVRLHPASPVVQEEESRRREKRAYRSAQVETLETSKQQANLVKISMMWTERQRTRRSLAHPQTRAHVTHLTHTHITACALMPRAGPPCQPPLPPRCSSLYTRVHTTRFLPPTPCGCLRPGVSAATRRGGGGTRRRRCVERRGRRRSSACSGRLFW